MEKRPSFWKVPEYGLDKQQRTVTGTIKSALIKTHSKQHNRIQKHVRFKDDYDKEMKVKIRKISIICFKSKLKTLINSLLVA